jgi:hypothetical protein
MKTTWALVPALSATLLGCVVHPPVQHVVPAARPVEARESTRYFQPPLAVTDPEEAVVRIVGPEMSCSGTVVDDDLVLTALHCVVKRGEGGTFTRELLSPSDLRVELGGDYLPWGYAKVSSVVTPVSEDGKPCVQHRGEGDVAVLVLAGKPVGLSMMTLRLEVAPVVGENLVPMGFGRCAMGAAGFQPEGAGPALYMSDDAIRRRQRSDGKVEWLNSDLFYMRSSICPGDSGGPVLAAGPHGEPSNEIVGVVSQSAMDGDPRTAKGSIMVRVDAFRGLFDRARHIADGTPASELPPVACGR